MPLSALRKDKGGSRADGDDIVLSPMDRRIERRLVTPQRVGLALGAVALLGLAAYGYARFGLSRALRVGAERVTVSTVSYGTFREYIPVTGNVVPRTTWYLDAIEGGQVTAVFVEEGELVEKGQPLIELKNTDLQIQVIAAEAQALEQSNYFTNQTQLAEQTRLRNQRELIENDYRIDLAERELARLRPLLATGGATQKQIDDLEAELTYRRNLRETLLEVRRLDEEFRANQIPRMESALAALNRSLEIARASLDNLVITAPISGQLTLLDANVGQSTSRGQRLGQIDELNAFKVSAFVDEFYLTRVAIGQTATVDIGRETYTLEIVKIYPDVRDRQFEIDLEFVGPMPELIRRGQTLRMRLEIGQPADTLVLANGAFYDDTGGQWVFVLDESGDFAERRSVRFGRRNPEGIEVLDGLEAGDRAITSSYESFMNFDRIDFRSGT
ncbi:MAG TPA: HlyD family efflux transporter periplasmic adaptor subunit [Gammaproteobacteria bacterium]